VSDAELERIRTAYEERDASADTPYRWTNAGYVGYMQDVERALLRALDDAGVQLAGARVLDVGCGSGYFLHRLQEYGAGECRGVDLMENRITEGLERYPSLKLEVASATELPFESGDFDLVTQFTCLSSIIHADTRLAAAREMRRVAAGGWILSFDMRRVRRSGPTPVVGLDDRNLRQLFGEPKLLRRVTLRFDLAQVLGRHQLIAQALAALPPLRSHLLGLWQPSSEAVSPPDRRP
jgi:SAM-dependent methyltransferase